MPIYRLWCAKCRDLHEIDQAVRPTLVQTLLRQQGSGCDGKFYRWTDYDNKMMKEPWVSALPFPEKPTWRIEEED